MLSLNEIKELMKLLEASPLTKIDLSYSDGHVVLEKGAAPAVLSGPAAVPPAPAAPAAAAPPPTPAESAQTVDITAPMVGTFYSAPDPKAPPFVKPGSHVTPSSVVCVLEAMKIFSEVEAEVEGDITDILVKDGDFVEFGQTLFRVKKSPAAS